MESKNLSFIEKRISGEAQSSLEGELKEIYSFFVNNKLLGLGLKVNDIKLVTHGADGEKSVFAEFFHTKTVHNTSNIDELVEERKKELIGEKTDEILRKFDAINYLFNEERQ